MCIRDSIKLVVIVVSQGTCNCKMHVMYYGARIKDGYYCLPTEFYCKSRLTGPSAFLLKKKGGFIFIKHKNRKWGHNS